MSIINIPQGFIEEYRHENYECRCCRDECLKNPTHQLSIYILMPPKTTLDEFSDYYHQKVFGNYEYRSGSFVVISEKQYYRIILCVCSIHFIEVLELLGCKINDAMYDIL